MAPNRLILRVACRLALALVAALQGTAAWAQTQPADVEAYREQRRQATATFLDRNASKDARLAAANRLGYPDEQTFAALLRIGQDRSEDDAIRLEALRRHRYDPAYVAAVLKILDDPEDGGEELDAMLIADLSRRTTSTPPPETRQAMQTTLRKLLADRRDRVRLFAFKSLVSNHDRVAIDALVGALRRGRDLPIPLAEAVALLDLDGPVNHIGTLRPYLTHPDPSVRAIVVRALAIDPQSRPRIIELARQRTTEPKVRVAALRGLAREDKGFAAYAIAMMEDARDDPTVREAAMTSMVGRLNYGNATSADVARFAQAVQRLANRVQPLSTAPPDPMTDKAREMIPFLRQSFPGSLP